MPISRRNILLAGVGFTGFIFLQFLSGKSKQRYAAAAHIEKLELSDQQWQQRLSQDAYYVLRKSKTEVRKSSSLNNEWREGLYCCVACELELFTSTMKYESNTGWPSFKDHIYGHLVTYTDLTAIPPHRAYKCARCSGHHGHLFMDGPLPRGERWCNNGVALSFILA